ncbi:hypothetical protein D3C86_2020660 [compost metagenome]
MRVLFLLINSASTSVPSITQPPLMASPIPPPKNNPPKKAINSGSWVMGLKGAMINKIAKAEMATEVLIANTLPICRYPKTTKGMLMSTMR